MKAKDLDMSYIISKSISKSKRRSIIVQFNSHNDRREFFNNEKRLKGTSVFNTDSLTAGRMLQLKNTRDQFGFNNVWSIDGRIIYQDRTSAKPKLFYRLVVKRIFYGKWNRFVFRIIGGIVVLLNYLLRLRNLFKFNFYWCWTFNFSIQFEKRKNSLYSKRSIWGVIKNVAKQIGNLLLNIFKQH